MRTEGVVRSIVTVALLLSLGLAGCANMSDTDRTRVEGSAVGAALGGLIGALVGDTEGAVIGALAGAGVGLIAGNEIAKRKARYASEEDFLEGEIASLQQMNQTARTYQGELARAIERLDRQTRRLQGDAAAGKKRRQELEQTREELAEAIRDNEKVLAALEKEYEVQQAILAEQQAKATQPDPVVERLAREVEMLRKNIESLQGSAKELAELDERLSV